MQALTFIASLGSLQGGLILLSIVLRYRHRKNLPLALFLIVFSIRLATIPTWDPDILINHPWIYPLTAPLPFLFGPLLWLFIRELGNDTTGLPRAPVIHFLPYLLEVSAVTATILLKTEVEYEVLIHNIFSGNPPLWLPLRNGLKVAVNVIYIVFSGRIAFGKRSKQFSDIRRLCARSLVVIPLIVLAAFSVVALPPSVTNKLADGFVLPFFILSVTMAFFIYGISFFLLTAPEIPIIKGRSRAGCGEKLCSDVECRMLVSMMEKRVEEGAFRNPDLLLADLAAELNIHPNRLSYAVNNCCGISFRTYLNRKRLEFFSAQIINGTHRDRSILDIAFESGFPSKSTFNRVFKDEMDMTPSEYVNQVGT